VETTGAAGTIRGRVVLVETGQHAPNADLQLVALTRSRTETPRQLADTAGAFSFDSVAAGRYVLRTRGIGLAMRIDTLRLEAGSGLALRVVTRPVVIDGCGFAVVVTKKPWWQWW
jgi:hypothetical protein